MPGVSVLLVDVPEALQGLGHLQETLRRPLLGLHFIFLVKYVLAEIIEDEPDWIQKDSERMQNRVEQVEKDNQDKKLLERLSDHYSELDLLFEVLKKQHKELTKSA